MSALIENKLALAVRGLLLIAIVVLAFAYFMPTWWVALTAPNYPPESFPNGVRINFQMNGVFNGCELQAKSEIYEVEALDCLHEMDAINHFVGMYPIASGGVVERALSQFLVSILAVILFGMLFFRPKVRMAVMSIGFAGLAGWMYLTYYGEDGLRYESNGYLDSLVVTLGHGLEEEGEELSPIIANLRQSLEDSGASSMVGSQEIEDSLERAGQIKLKEALARLHKGSDQQQAKSLKQILAEAKQSGKTGRDVSIQILKNSFEADQVRKPAAERVAWNGSIQQVAFWHYEKSLGRWFNNPAEIDPLVKTMTMAGTVVFWGVIAGMFFLVFAARKNSGLFFWLLWVIPVMLPVFFIVEYASWLWWYGHSLNDMGAFTLKPFMPTVFGQGKVAQFSTHSYPYLGFGMMVVFAVVSALAGLLRRKDLNEA